MIVHFPYYSDSHQADLDVEATVTSDCVGPDCGWYVDDVCAMLAGEQVQLTDDEIEECYGKAQLAAASQAA